MGNRQSQNILTKMKSLDPENIFSFLTCCKNLKIDSYEFVQSWVGVK